MQGTEKAGQIAADELGIGCQLFDGICRCLEHGVIGLLLVTVYELPKLFGNGERDHEMVSGQLMFDPIVQPQVLFTVLAPGAMPVAAGSEDRMGLVAFFALKDGDAEMRASTVGDGRDRIFLDRGHTVAVNSDILVAVLIEDGFNGCHGRLLSSDR